MTADRFFDRKTYLDLLQKRTNGLLEGYRQNIAVVGDELVGKTTIVVQFLNRFFDSRVVVLYMEVKHESLLSFVRRFTGVLLYNFLSGSGITLKEDLDFLIEKAHKYIPRTISKVNAVLAAAAGRKEAILFAELLSIVDVMHQETGKYCLIVFDEFHNLEEIGFKQLYRDWSKALLTQKYVMYILVSSMKFKTKTILAKNLSLLFGNFEVVEVEPFDVRSSEQFLSRRLQNINLNAALKNFIVHFTGGYPLYLEIVAREIQKSGPQHFSVILENLLFDPSGVLHQRFSNYIKRFLDLKHSADYLGILYLVANGRNKISDIAHLMGKQKAELNGLINYLLEMDAITRSADFLKINDRVFGFWLKFVYQEMLQSLTFDGHTQKRKFRDSVEDMVREYSASMQKPIMERLSEVLRLFEDEIAQIERKKVRLNRFREVKPLEFNNRNFKEGLLGRSHDSLWILGVKNGLLTEDDITAFAHECKKYNKGKLQQKIIVTLHDIDANTRLRALEEKIWTWDINDVNHIFDLFCKPCVVA